MKENLFELKNLNKLTNEEILRDLSKLDKSSLLTECILNKDIKCINELIKRLKGINNVDYLQYASYINKHILNSLSKNIDGDTNIEYIGNLVDVQFPIDSFSDEIKDFIFSISEGLQVSTDMIAVAILAIFSISLQKNFRISIKNDWSEPLNLYCVIIALPSEKKSPIISLLIKPILEFEKEKNNELKPKILKNNLLKESLEKSRERIVKNKNNQAELEELSKQLMEFKEINEIKYFVDDVTVEKLTSLMSTNNNCMSIISTEGGIFDIMLGQYSRTPNFEIFLKAYTGDTLKVDRINRGSEILENPRLSILLAIQPNVINKIVSNTLLREKGLISRFLFSFPKSMVGNRKFETKEISPILKEKYNTLVKTLLSIENKEEKIIFFDKGAKEELEKFFYEIESEITSNYESISDWCGKLLGNTSRIAGILALIDNYNTDIVSRENVLNAINIAKYFLQNTLNIFKHSSYSENVKEANYILEYIQQSKLYYFKIRDIVRGRGKYNTNSDAELGLTELQNRKYIFLDSKSNTYFVNPKLYQNNID